MNKRVIGFAIISLTLISVMLWELWGRETLSYKTVLVLKEDMPANTVVKEEDFKIKRIENPSGRALTQKDEKKLIGMETSQYVAADTELREEYFELSDFIIGGDTGKALLSLSADWLMSYPQTLRRGDKISLYNGTVRLMEGIVIHVKDGSGQEIVSSDTERLDSSGTPSHIEIIGKEDDLVEVSRQARDGGRFTLTTVR